MGNMTTAAADNTSDQGKAALVPPEVDRWNWGAFLLNWIWGIGNATPIALLVFIPFFGFVWIFVLGAKGSAWAWRNRKWDSVAHFRRVQRLWTIWACVALAAIIVFAVALFLLVGSVLKGSEAYRLGVETLNANAQAVEILGKPISTGSPTGSIDVSNGEGKAELSFSVTGSKASGTIYLKASKDMGTWRLDREELQIEGTQDRIDLLPKRL
jgi:heme/copper-type cytochrome/quinol oxidase subunit 2